MKRILLFSLITLSVCCCTKDPAKEPEKEPAKEPNLELQVNEIQETSVRVTTTIDTGSYKIISNGVCYSNVPNPTINDLKVVGVGSVSIVNLDPGMMYYAKAYCTTEKDKTFYSSCIQFTTNNIIISVEISDINYRSAKVIMGVSEDISTISERGIVYSKTSQLPTTADTKFVGSTHDLTLLDYETTYYIRSYLIISGRTIYSATSEFTTKTLERVSDYDGNQYRVIEMASKTGPRLWLLDNFKGTHYANGDPIPHITDDNQWACLSSGAYCYYDNNKDYAKTYGALYNWWTAMDSRGLIIGWHLPSDKEWFDMSEIIPNEVWGTDFRGQKLKEAGTEHWQAPNQGANNQTGFTALPAGGRDSNSGEFYCLKTYAYFHADASIGDDAFWVRILYHNKNEFRETSGVSKKVGASIRLIKSK